MYKGVFVFLIFFPLFGSASSFKVVSFNTWLLEIFRMDIASDILERRDRIVDAINNLDADVVSFQEVWSNKHRDFLIEQLSEKYPYCVFDDNTTNIFKMFADGLITFSKYPINNYKDEGCTEPSNTLRFSTRTSLDEAFINKGAIHFVIDHPALGPIDLYNSHLGALKFEVEDQDYNSEHKNSLQTQFTELVDFINNTSNSLWPQILTIDLNRHFRLWLPDRGESHLLGNEYSQMIGRLQFVDTFMDANNYNPLQLTGVYSYDTQNNDYAREYMFGEAPPTLIDYIFYRGDHLQPVESDLIFTELIDGYLLSDHYGVMTTFESSQ